MSSSDGEWRSPPVFPGGKRPTGGHDAMMAARRRAMQQTREAAARPSNTESLQTDQKNSKTDGRFPWEDPPESSSAPPPSSQGHPRRENPQVSQTSSNITEEMLEALRRELNAKKKVLAAAKEKEEALRERWRAQKAQRLAQIEQLDEKIRKRRDAAEDAKAMAERELRDAEADQQQFLKEERERIESEIQKEYEPRIAEVRAQLKELQEKEAKLQSELNAGDNAKDLVNRCISSALSTILQRVEGMFAKDTSTMKEWENDVQRLVRHEVRSSFAVSNDSESQREREDYQRFFEDTLAFWKRAEAEQREHVLKMDEQLLLDLQSLVHDDLDRLQREELNMEELYVQAREAWAEQQQQLLQRELTEAISRRAGEFEEQRAARHQLHLERMKAAEELHNEMVSKQRYFHDRQMELLREQYANEERIAEQRLKMTAAIQEDVTRAAEEFGHVVGAVEGLLQLLKDYRGSIDAGRAAVESDRRRALEAREETLTALQDIVSKQTVATNDEYISLSATLNKLETVRALVEKHVEEERLWLGKQEATISRHKAEWEREYRRWGQMVEVEKGHVLERFNGVLAELQDVATLLASEEREMLSEQTSISSWLQNMSEDAAAEIRQLQKREEDLKERRIKMQNLCEEMQQKGAQINEQWSKLHLERQELAKEQAALREDEIKLQQVAQYLKMLKAQVEDARVDSMAAKGRARSLQYELLASQAAAKEVRRRGGCAPHHCVEAARVKLRRFPGPADNSPSRLPLRVLNELRDILDDGNVNHFTTAAVAPRGLDFQHVLPASLSQGGEADETPAKVKRYDDTHTEKRKGKPKYVDPTDVSPCTTFFSNDSSNNFTSLAEFSDSENVPDSTFHSS